MFSFWGKNLSLARIIAMNLLAVILAASLCGCTLFRPLGLPQLREFKKDVRKLYPHTSVSCQYNYEAGVHITVTGPNFDEESAFTILGHLRAVVSDEAFIQDLFELFEKESHGDQNWKNGERPEIWLYLCVDGKDRYQFTAGAYKEVYNSGRSPDSYTWDGYTTWHGTEIVNGSIREISSEEIQEEIKKYS